MVQSRLNKRIRKVRNNISGRQKLLSKLLRIKKQQKGTKRRPALKQKPKQKPKVVNQMKKRKVSMKPVVRRPRRRRIVKPKSIANTNANTNTNQRVISIPSNNVIINSNTSMKNNSTQSIKNNSTQSMKNNSTQSMKNNSTQSMKNNSTQSMNSNMNNETKCVLKNVHDEMVEIPISYPGDMWVHNNLEHQRDKPLEYFNDEHLKDVYGHHRKICFGN